MKIELDFDQKIIIVVSEVNMKELYDKIKSLNLDPAEWKLQHNKVFQTIYPVFQSGYQIIQPPIQPINGDDWKITCDILKTGFDGTVIPGQKQ